MIRLTHFLIVILSLCIAEAQSFKAVIQKGHGEVIKSARFTDDGKYLITASRDKTAKVWDSLTGMELRSFAGHDHTVNHVDIHENVLATSSADGTAALWNLLTGEMIWKSEKIREYVTSVDLHPDGTLLAIGSYADSVQIIDTRTLEVVRKIRTNPDKGVGYGVDVLFNPDGKYLSLGEDQRTTKIYETSKWTLVNELMPEQGYCGGCGTLNAFSPDSKSILKLSNGTSFVKYNLESGEKEAEYGENFRDIMSTDFHTSGDYYLASTEDSVFVFSSSDKLHSKFSMEGKINDAAFHPTENQIIVALDKIAILVDLEGREISRYHGILNESSTGLDYDLGNYWERHIARWVKYKSARMLDQKSIFIGKTGSKARKWDVKSASILMEYIGHEKGILCFERIGENLIATGGGDGKVIIWDEKKGKVIKVINAHREPVFDIKLSNNGKWLATCAWDGVISVWNTSTWERYKYVYNEGASAYEIAFTDNDAYLVTALLDKSLQLLEIETGRFVKEFIGHTEVVTSVSIQQNQILTSGWDGQIIEWDLYSGLIKRRIKSDNPVFSAKWHKEMIVSGGANRNVSFWNKNGEVDKLLMGHHAEINGLEIDGNLMITSDVDGVTKFWDLEKKKELFEHIQIGKNDWMVKSPGGYFDATDDAVSNIHFVRGMDVYGASQLMDRFYVPGLVEEIFSKKGSGVSLGKAVNQSPPPLLKLNGVLDSEGSAKLYLKVEDRGGGIERVTLFHNGKKVPFDTQVQKVRSEDQATVYTIQFPLVAGLNEFSATAYSHSNLESNRPGVTLFSDSKLPGSTCHILAVGINEYKNESLNLNYARPDASSFANQMKDQGEAIYSNVVLHQIYDQDATRAGILNKIEELKKEVSINDVFIFYYAGHGSMIDGSFYLVSSLASRLYDNQKIKEYGIGAAELQNAMLEIKALKQLIIMDACQSGGSVEVLAQRGAPEEKAIAQLSRSSGIHVMAAAGSDQYATEFESLGHGLFTYALLKGLQGAADGAPKDGKVTIYELKSYLDDQVPELSIQYKGSPQYPHTFSRGQDFPVVVIDN